MRSLRAYLDYEVAKLFEDEDFQGIGTIERVEKSSATHVFKAGKHEVHVEEIGGGVLKLALDPANLNQDLLVAHRKPAHRPRGDHEVALPKRGERFSITVKRGPHTLLSPYVTDSVLQLDDELSEMFTVNVKNGFTRVSFRIPTQYGIYGLGESFTSLNKRGKTMYTFPADNGCHLNSKLVYKGIPFFLTNAGFGVVFPHYEPIKFDFGESLEGLVLVTVPAKALTFYIILGTPREVVSTFVEMFGENPLPPPWSFGLWWSRWAGIGPRSPAEVRAFVEKFEEHGIPLDVVQLDPQWLKDYVPGVTQAFTFEWDREKFPAEDEVGEYLRQKGKRLGLWVNPYVALKGPAYEKLKDCLLKDGEGRVALVPNLDGNPKRPARGMVDFARGECAELWTSMLADLLERSKAQVAMSDFGETVPPEAVDCKGTPGYMLRNKLGDLYQLAAYEAVRRATRGEGVIWGRSGSLLSHNLPVKWGGDENSTWEGLRATIRGALSAGISGALFYGFDIGGFCGRPGKKLLLRWAGAAALFSHIKLHGKTGREPWLYDEEAVKCFRELVELRYRLLPYILSEAEKAVRERVPLVRPLVMDYPDDPNTQNIEDEYMFGSSMLVAPILSEDDWRKIYLPEGEWVYFYDGAVYGGCRWIVKGEGLNRVPFFVKKGSTIELAEGKGKNVEDYLRLPRVKRAF